MLDDVKSADQIETGGGHAGKCLECILIPGIQTTLVTGGKHGIVEVDTLCLETFFGEQL
ncbi:hypothetical protein SSTU70S_05044 [Stutzerimonas stutzeri]